MMALSNVAVRINIDHNALTRPLAKVTRQMLEVQKEVLNKKVKKHLYSTSTVDYRLDLAF